MKLFEIPIIFQDSEVLVVNKPSGLSVHNNEDPQNLLKILCKQLQVKQLYPVHRLDRETSGVQILAFNSSAAKSVSIEFQKREIKKYYQGILRGRAKIKGGVWSKPLTDRAEGRKNPAGLSAKRVVCETRFKVIKNSDYFTLCEFQLITGRQHQIRKHSVLANHALVGDTRYGDLKYNKKIEKIYNVDRLFLHCKEITLMNHKFLCSVPAEFELLF